MEVSLAGGVRRSTQWSPRRTYTFLSFPTMAARTSAAASTRTAGTGVKTVTHSVPSKRRSFPARFTAQTAPVADTATSAAGPSPPQEVRSALQTLDQVLFRQA